MKDTRTTIELIRYGNIKLNKWQDRLNKKAKLTFSAWSNQDSAFTFVQGTTQPEPNLTLLKVFEAESWDDALKQYHEWQGWETYKPMGTY